MVCSSPEAEGFLCALAEVTMSYAVNSKTPYTYKAPRLGMVKIDFSTGTAAVVRFMPAVWLGACSMQMCSKL